MFALQAEHLQTRSDTARAVGPHLVKPMSFRLSCRLYRLLGLSSQVVVPYDLIKCSLSFSSKVSTIKLP